jgi:hypothetical protein
MKTEKIIGIIWFAFSLIYLFQGFIYLYRYSAPTVLWAFMIPILIAYTKIVLGILCSYIAINFIKGKSGNDIIMILLTFLILIFTLIEIFKYGMSITNCNGENLLLLLLIVITFRILKIQIGITKFTEKTKDNKVVLIGFIILGILPYVLTEFTNYSFYNFLH